MKQRQEQRKLVQQGKLPEESLWGRVRASQPRLHNFFGVPEHAKAETETGSIIVTNKPSDSNEKASSACDRDEDCLDAGWAQSCRPAFPQKAFTSPPQNITVKAKASEKKHRTNLIQADEQEDFHARPRIQAQLDMQLSFSASQMVSDFADDGDLEAELNGPIRSEKESQGLLIRKLNINAAGQKESFSRKRRADDLAPTPPPSAKNARLVFAHMSLSMLNTRAQEQNDASSGSSPTGPGLNHPTGSTGLPNLPTASQREAMFESQDFADADANSDKENIKPCRESPPAKRPSPGSRGMAEELGMANSLNGDSDEEFGPDVDDEMSKLAFQVIEVAKGPSKMISKSASSKTLEVQRSSQRQPVRQASPQQSKVRDLADGVEDNFYELDGVDDVDLAGLVDKFNSSLNGEVSPQETTSSRSESGRSILWDKTSQLLEEEDCTDLDFPGEEDWA